MLYTEERLISVVLKRRGGMVRRIEKVGWSSAYYNFHLKW